MPSLSPGDRLPRCSCQQERPPAGGRPTERPELTEGCQPRSIPSRRYLGLYRSIWRNRTDKWKLHHSLRFSLGLTANDNPPTSQFCPLLYDGTTEFGRVRGHQGDGLPLGRRRNPTTRPLDMLLSFDRHKEALPSHQQDNSMSAKKP